MIDKTEATVLAIRPFSETSHVVTWLNEDGEKLITFVKGACRPKSMFQGQYDLFYTCELVLYRKDHHDLHVAKECCVLKSRNGLRHDWRAAAAASYLCGLVADMTESGTPQPRLCGHLTATLDFLSAHGGTPQLLLWFEIQLHGILGWAPQLARCVGCDKPLHPRKTVAVSVARGGICCQPCATTSEDVAEDLAADSLAILRRWQLISSPRAANAMRCTQKQLLVCRSLLGKFLQYHMDLMPEGRRIALNMTSTVTLAAQGRGRRP